MSPAHRASGSPPFRIARLGVELFWYLGWAALVMSVALTILTATTDFGVKYIRPPLQVDLREVAQTEAGDLAAPGSLPIAGFGPVTVEAPANDPLQPYVLLMPIALLVCYLYAFRQLRSFLRAVTGGGFFTTRNVGRLRRMAWTVLIVGPLWGVLDVIYARLYAAQVSIGVGHFEPIVNFRPEFMLSGVVLLVLTQAFEYGCRLQHEQDLTI